MKRFFGLLTLSLLITPTFGAVSRFSVQVSPSVFKVNESVDLTIKAVDGDDKVVKDANNDIVIEVKKQGGEALPAENYTLPSDGIYSFIAEDQGAKTFSKGLKITKPGEYKIEVFDVISESIKGEATIEVKAGSDGPGIGDIKISSPIKGGIEKNPNFQVVGTSSLKNSPLQVFVDGKKMTENITNDNGDFTIFLNNVTTGRHEIQIKIFDVNDVMLGESEVVDFFYAPEVPPSYKSLVIEPQKIVEHGTKLTFKLTVEEGVSSAELELKGDAKYPMDKINSTTFQKQILLEKAGEYSVSVFLTVNSNITKFSDIDKVKILEVTEEIPVITGAIPEPEEEVPPPPVIEKEPGMISNIMVFRDKIDLTQVSVSWETSGDVEMYQIMYGKSKDIMEEYVLSTGTAVILSGISSTKTYYLQIIPLDAQGFKFGSGSDIVSIDPVKPSAPLCKVSGIFVKTEQIGDRYYLTWNEAEGADRYVIYKADELVDSIDLMQKVGETSDTKFEYPYDPNAKKDTYAYYAVEAQCQDGGALKIDEIKKIKVGPFDSIPFFILLGLIGYGMYRLNRIVKNEQ